MGNFKGNITLGYDAIKFYLQNGEWPPYPNEWIFSLSRWFSKNGTEITGWGEYHRDESLEMQALNDLERVICSEPVKEERVKLLSKLNHWFSYGWEFCD